MGVKAVMKNLPFIVFIKTLEGTTRSLTVNHEDTIFMVKHTLLDMTGVPVDQQLLVFQGRRLEDHRTIKDNTIRSESTVHFLLQLRAGMQQPAP